MYEFLGLGSALSTLFNFYNIVANCWLISFRIRVRMLVNLLISCMSLLWWSMVDFKEAMVSLRMMVERVSVMVELRITRKT